MMPIEHTNHMRLQVARQLRRSEVFRPVTVRADALKLRLRNAGMGHNRRSDTPINLGVGCTRRQICEAEPYSFIPQLCCDVMPSPERLDVRGIALTHRAVDSKLLAMLVEPSPHSIAGVGAIAARKIGCTAVAISSGRYAAAVE